MATNGFLIAPTVDALLTEQSNFSFLLTADNFPTAAKDGGASSFLNGGGSLQFYTGDVDEPKTTRLAVEVQEFTTGGTPLILVWGLASELIDTTQILVVDSSETSQPAVGAPYGRNAVWADWEIVSHDLVTDSTGNYSNPFTINGTPSQVNGAFGNANGGYSFNGSNQWVDVDLDGRDPLSGVGDDEEVTIMAFMISGSTSTFNRAMHVHDSGTKSVQLFKNNGGTSRFGATGASGITPQTGYFTSADSSVYNNVMAVVSLSTAVAYPTTNIVAIGGDTSNTEISVNTADQGNSTAAIRFGARNDGGGDYNGTLSEARFRKNGLSAATITDISNNLDNTASFWLTGALDDQDTKAGLGDVIITNLSAEENRIENIAVGDQIEFQRLVDGYNFWVNNDGTISTGSSTPSGSYEMDIRIWDYTDSTWGAAAVQTVTVGGNIPVVPSGSTRNDLLAQIVVASGGTVTNPNNRNSLLQDWLNAL